MIGGVAAFIMSIYIFPPFTLTLVKNIPNPFGEIRTYADLNNDGLIEEIYTYTATEGVIGINLYSSTHSIWQENFYGELAQHPELTISNIDGDNVKEVVIAYVRNDSVFFGAIEFISNERLLSDVFITTVKSQGNINQDLTIILKAVDLDNDGSDELIFNLVMGFGMLPRMTAVYYPKQGEIYHTPLEWEAHFGLVNIHDLNGDGEVEIILSGNAPGNSKDTLRYMHDHKARLIVLDRFLRKYPGEFGSTCVGCGTTLFSIDNNMFFNYLTNDVGAERTYSYRLYFDGSSMQYELVKVHDGLLGLSTDSLPTLATVNFTRLLDQRRSGILNTDFSFNELEIPQADYMKLDSREFSDKYYYATKDQNILILNDDLYYQKIPIPITSSLQKPIEVSRNGDKQILLIMFDQHFEIYSLDEHSYWVQRIGFILISLIILLVFTWLVSLLIEVRKRKKQQQLLSLRVKALRNQLEPHFALNLMSSIKLHLLKNDVLAAEELFDLYTKILKYTLSGAEEIGAKLSDELKYVSTYLEIEQKQSDQLKSFHIEIDPELTDFEVPKMLIQEHVENALKHGIRKLEDQSGHLAISARKIKGTVEISIADNGIGRGNGFKDSGKGIALTYELLEIFNTLTKQKVVQQITDLPKGTKVTITAQL